MQSVEDMYHIGAVILERYQIEDILGVGGFSVVYLVRDRLIEDGEEQSEPMGAVGAEKRFALKVLTDRNKQERARFRYEAEILTRLHHPALPRIHHIFEDGTTHQAYILMDYVEGTNLNILRKQRAEEGFSLTEALVMLAPIVEALSYLHAQPSPIIHRDIKPANLIVPQNGKGTVLVDFGIAKEYELDATTTAIRHCSPGYAAPEQYSSIGTDQRTDIYALAATLYVLLSTVVPVDALRRTTALASKEVDPLLPLNTLVPTIPTQVADAIHCAMSIDMRNRFSSVKGFWQALQAAADQDDESQDADSHGQRKQGQVDEVHQYLGDRAVTRRRTHIRRERQPTRLSLLMTGRKFQVLWSLVVAALVLLAVSTLAFVSVYPAWMAGNKGGEGHDSSHPYGYPTGGRNTPAIMRGGADSYPVVGAGYSGSVHDLLANKTIPITLTRIAQNNERISGSFSGMGTQGSFTGVLDTSRHIFFTVSGRPALFFDGAIRSDSNLVGNYCTIDAAGQCVGQYGVWSLAPVR